MLNRKACFHKAHFTKQELVYSLLLFKGGHKFEANYAHPLVD